MKKLFIAVVSFGILAVACKKDDETLNFDDSKFKITTKVAGDPDYTDTFELRSNDSIYLKGLVGIGKWSYDGDSLKMNLLLEALDLKLVSAPTSETSISGNITLLSNNVGTFTGTKVN
ncbi:MAG: hypothetical protein K1X55_14525 [Chitinophagales bacterium]|nr:hypothetical protein [Chitinophagales bacterium]